MKFPNVSRRAAPLLAALLSWILASAGAWAQPGGAETKTVIVEGVAGASDNLRARDDAIEDAFRRAVEQGAGVLVDSGTMTENFELIADHVLTKAAGYVRSHEILSEGAQNGLYRVRIRCEVALGPIKDDLMALRILQVRRGLPRVVVIGEELVDGIPTYDRAVAQEIEGYLVSKEFDLVAGDFFEDLKRRDAALAENVYNDYSQAVALAERHNAEAVVVYKAQSDYAGEHVVMGRTWHRYTPNGGFRVVSVTNARLLASFNWGGPRMIQGDSSKGGAARKALLELGYSAAPEVMDRLVEKWESDFKLELVVSDTDYEFLARIKADLSEARGIKTVGQIELTGSVGIIRMTSTIPGSGLAERLRGIFGRDLQIEEITESRVKARASRSSRGGDSGGRPPRSW